MKRICFILLLTYTRLCAQTVSSDYPQHYFRDPLDIPIVLAGNFGECRPAHFHSGLDIKTQGKENLPVYAAADGYISRLKIEKGGFGHAIYITHPNGYTTLYAHLNNFIQPVQEYLRKQQYAQEKWNVDLTLSPEQFPVKQGEQIAWSGNTGASTAPHLHFEIRDTKTEHPVNEGLFGFDISDARPPVLYQLAVYNLRNSIYEQKPQFFPFKKKGNNYFPEQDTVKTASDHCGIAIVTDDFMDGSDNTLAFYKAELYMDDSLQSRIVLDNIGYEETRYVNAYADYKTHEQKGFWPQCFFQLPGNKLNSIYRYLRNGNGKIVLSDSLPHKIKIVVVDFSGNKTEANMVLTKTATATQSKSSVECVQKFLPENANDVKLAGLVLNMKKDALYDTVCMRLSIKKDNKAYSPRYQIHFPYVPVHSYFDINIKPDKPVPFSLRNKMAMIYSDGKNEEGMSVQKKATGWYYASVRSFGEYRLVADTSGPKIAPTQRSSDFSRAEKIVFTVTDDISFIKTFRAELDGKWLLFEPKGNSFFYEFDDHCSKGKHTLSITATDDNDNATHFSYTFTR